MSQNDNIFRRDPPRLLLALGVIVIGVALWQLASGISDGSEAGPGQSSSTTEAVAWDPDALDGGWLTVELPGRAPLVGIELRGHRHDGGGVRWLCRSDVDAHDHLT